MGPATAVAGPFLRIAPDRYVKCCVAHSPALSEHRLSRTIRAPAGASHASTSSRRAAASDRAAAAQGHRLDHGLHRHRPARFRPGDRRACSEIDDDRGALKFGSDRAPRMRRITVEFVETVNARPRLGRSRTGFLSTKAMRSPPATPLASRFTVASRGTTESCCLIEGGNQPPSPAVTE